MQEEVENRTLTLTVNATKFTGRVLKAALSKYQYAVYKTANGQYQMFFKAPSEASMNAAFQKYSKNRLKKEQRRESVLGKLKKFKELVKAPVPNREKRREQER